MAQRRYDIVPADRAQIVIEMMSPNRPWGRVKQLSEMYQLSRQSLQDRTPAVVYQNGLLAQRAVALPAVG